MNNKVKILMVLAVIATVAGLGIAQSDYATRSGTPFVAAKAPQSTVANIHARQGLLVGHYAYGTDGALVINTQKVIKEGSGAVTMPDNAIFTSNSLAVIDVTTAANPTTCTGAIYIGTSLIYTGTLGTATQYQIQLGSTKLTADSTLRIVSSANVPTNALSVSVYVPYILGD